MFKQVFFQVKLLSSVVRTHVANGSINGSFGAPWTVISSQYPKNTAIGIGISAIQRIFVIQMNHDFKRIARRRRPLKNFLSPKHAKVIMNSPFFAKLILGSVPNFVMSLGKFQFFQAV